jgi:hypothetical protein
MKMDHETALFQKMESKVEMPDTGCCGMAGPFGFEREKYEVSIAVGERVLLPAVRKKEQDAIIVADGFSCREQVTQQTNRHAMHLADALKLALVHGENGPPGKPEDAALAQIRHARCHARIKLAVGIAVGVTALGYFFRLSRRGTPV